MKTFRFDPLPGAGPYSSHRRMRVRERFDGMTLVDFLLAFHPPTEKRRWIEWITAGDICIDSQVVDVGRIVCAGDQYVHTLHNVCEPDVAPEIGVLHEDDSIIVVDKPAPLPVHPSGRFNRNTLLFLLQSVYGGDKLRMAHRLDANTSGVIVVCRSAEAATSIQTQFAHARSRSNMSRWCAVV